MMGTENTWLQIFWIALCCASSFPTVLIAIVRIPRHKFSAGIEIELPDEPPPPPPLPTFKKRTQLFYTVGLCWIILLLWTFVQSRCIGQGTPCWVDTVLQIIATPSGVGTDVTSTVIALCVLLIHLATRWYTSTFVSVFSHQLQWDLLDVVLAYPYFGLVGLTIASEAPWHIYNNCSCLDGGYLQGRHLVGIILYLWASYHHFKSHQILANLRKDETGRVVTYDYKMPKDDWFKLVACPHYFAEILIHIAIGCILGLQHVTWWIYTVYVFVYQLCLAHNTHQGYMNMFNGYPRNRKMLIPYLL